MQVNMLEAKNQLPNLVKAAVDGEEVIIACNGQNRVRLVPCEPLKGLVNWGCLAGEFPDIDAAFAAETEVEVARLFGAP